MTLANSMLDKASEWFVRREGQVRGPFSSARVRHYVLEGRLQMRDEVSNDKITWEILSQVPEVVPSQFRRDGELDARALAKHERSERLRAWKGIGVAMGLIILAIASSLWLGGQGKDVPIDCRAPIAPGVQLHACRLDGIDLTSRDLRGADLTDTSLRNAKLSDANLSNADLGYSALQGADLGYALLQGSRLLGANLRNANLANADLSGADLSFADLSGALLGNARFDNARLDGAIWSDGRHCAETSLGRCR